MSADTLPEFRPWSIAAVRLLQGVVYSDDARTWDLVLSNQSPLANHFGRLGLLLVIDEPEGLAYLRQLAESELPPEYETLPKLFRKSRLGYDPTLLCVLLREELRRYEEEDVHNERCVVEAAMLFEAWKTFFPPQHDEVKQRREFSAALTKLEDLGFVRRFSEEPEAWEIRRILKARLPVAELESLKAQLLAAVASRGKSDRAEKSDA
jgi:hypothetical protein